MEAIVTIKHSKRNRDHFLSYSPCPRTHIQGTHTHTQTNFIVTYMYVKRTHRRGHQVHHLQGFSPAFQNTEEFLPVQPYIPRRHQRISLREDRYRLVGIHMYAAYAQQIRIFFQFVVWRIQQVPHRFASDIRQGI